MIKYIAYYDNDTKSVVVVFGTDEEIEDDCLCWGYGDEHEHEQYLLGELLVDTGSLCEEYLIDCQDFKHKDDVEKVEAIVEQFDCFIKDVRLKNCSWG